MQYVMLLFVNVEMLHQAEKASSQHQTLYYLLLSCGCGDAVLDS
jgi:hypothetical protein